MFDCHTLKWKTIENDSLLVVGDAPPAISFGGCFEKLIEILKLKTIYFKKNNFSELFV